MSVHALTPIPCFVFFFLFLLFLMLLFFNITFLLVSLMSLTHHVTPLIEWNPTTWNVRPKFKRIPLTTSSDANPCYLLYVGDEILPSCWGMKCMPWFLFGSPTTTIYIWVNGFMIHKLNWNSPNNSMTHWIITPQSIDTSHDDPSYHLCVSSGPALHDLPVRPVRTSCGRRIQL